MKILNLTLDSERPNRGLDEVLFKQGNKNRSFKVQLFDAGILRTISDTEKPIIIFDYYDKSHFVAEVVLKDGETTDYNITVSNDTITIPARKEIVDFSGNVKMTILLDDLYTYEIMYSVSYTRNYASSISAINNLPQFNSKADINLSNVPNIIAADEGDMFYKKGGTLVKAPLNIDDTDRIIKSEYSLQVPPQSLKLGLNTTLHESGGFLEYHTNSLNKNYLLLDYENDPTTGTKKPIYYQRGIKEIKVVEQSDTSVIMTNVSSFAFGAPTYDRQIQKLYFNFNTAVTNLKIMLNINGKDISDYPVGSWDDDNVSGYSFSSGEHAIDLLPFWSELTEYNIVVKLKASSSINLLGNGTIPYLAFDLNRITRKDIALVEDISGGGVYKFTELTDTPSKYTGNSGKVLAVKGGEDGLEFVNAPTPGEVETLHFRHAFGVKAMNKTGQTIPANSFVFLSPKTNGRYNMALITKETGYKGEMFGLLEVETANNAEATVHLIDNMQTGINGVSEGVPAYVGFLSEGADNQIGIEEKGNLAVEFGRCGVFGGINELGEYMASFDSFQVQAEYSVKVHHDSDIAYYDNLPAVIDKDAFFVYIIGNIVSPDGIIEQPLPVLSEVENGMQIIIENQSASVNAKIRLTAIPNDTIEGAATFDVTGGNHKVILIATKTKWMKLYDSITSGGGDLTQQVNTNIAGIASNKQDIITLQGKSLTLKDGTHTISNVEEINVTGAVVQDLTGGAAKLAIPREVEDLIEYGASLQSTTPVDDSWKIGKCEPNQIVHINATSGNKYLVLLVPNYIEPLIEEIKINNNIVEHREVDQTINNREYKMLISTTTFDASQNSEFKLVYNSEVVPTGLEIDDGTTNKAGIKKINVENMKLSKVFDDSSEVTLTAEGEPTFVDGETGKDFKASKIQSLDKSIRIANLNGVADLAKGVTDHNEGIHICLGSDEIINSKYNKSKLYFSDTRVKGGSSVYVNLQNKSFVIQDVDPQDDPNISGGTTFIVGLYYEPNQDNENEITQDGNIKLGLFDNNDDYILDTSGNPMIVQIDYKAGDIAKPELYLGECQVKAYTEVHLKIELDFPNEELITVGANTQLCLQAISKDESSGLALLSFMAFTGYRIGFDTKYYGFNSLNLARALVFNEPEIEVSNDTMDVGDNVYINVKTKAKLSISNYHLNISDNGTDLPIWSIVKLYNELDSHFISGKSYKVTAKLTDKDDAFRVGLLRYTGTDRPAPRPIVESYNNENPIFTSGWTLVDSLFISEDAVVGDHVATKTFTIPDNSKGIAIIMYPVGSQIPCNLKLKDLEGDITPWFNKVVITNNSHIRESYLELADYAYCSIVATPSGYTGYRYTVGDTDTKLPIGVVSGGDNKIINDNSWIDAGSVDPNKTQGDFKFLTDGKVKMNYAAQCLNEQGTLNQIHFWLAKNNGDGTFTEVTNSRLGTTIEANRNKTPKMIKSTQFTFNVKANETYRFFGKSDKSDGFYLESFTNGIPLLRFDIDFDEITEDEANLLDMITTLDDEIIITDAAKAAGWYIELDYNTDTQKPSLSPKQRNP